MISPNFFFGQTLSQIWIEDDDSLWHDCAEILAEQQSIHLDQQALEETLSDFAACTNLDSEIQLSEILFDWLGLKNNSASNMKIYGVTSFHTIWEAMCRCFIINSGEKLIEDYSKLFSQPQYLIDGISYKLGPQRPDYVLKSGNDVCIVDAKWYRALHHDLPLLGDAVKQTMYALTFLAEFKVVANYYVLPHLDDEISRSRGKLQFSIDNVKDERFSEVELVSLNWRVVADCYRGLPSVSYPISIWRK